MVDIVDKKTRSKMMAGIRGKNTNPEIRVRKALFARGFRYRLHPAEMPGKPDIVLPKFSAVIFVNGCFWHGHDCNLFKLPSTRKLFWKEKIEKNKSNDAKALQTLMGKKWRVLVIWECALKGRTRLSFEEVMERAARWIKAGSNYDEIRGAE